MRDVVRMLALRFFYRDCGQFQWPHIARPFDGQVATAGNGTMPAFRAGSRAKGNKVYEAGIANGGADEGTSGIRKAYTDDLYVAFLRFHRSKVAIFFKG